MNKNTIIIVFSMFMVWITGTSFIYVDSITQYPHSIIENYHLPLNGFFDWVDDPVREKKGMDYAKAHGYEWEAKMMLNMGFRFVKPVFSTSGYFNLVFLPVVIILSVFFCVYHKYLR